MTSPIPASPPSLLAAAPAATRAASGAEAKSLLDLMVDGYYMIFLLKNRYLPESADSLRAHLRDFLLQLERNSEPLDTPAEDLRLAKYAYCALVDETVLSTQPSLRDDWQRRPLQLELFGDQLAGERFFERLERLRHQGAARVQVLEVFHMCLLMGFRGRYLIDGEEKLAYLSARVGDEVARHKGQRAAFAPHWAAPDTFVHKLRAEVPLWVAGIVFALAALLAYAGLRWGLQHQTATDLGAYSQLVKPPALAANVTITLP